MVEEGAVKEFFDDPKIPISRGESVGFSTLKSSALNPVRSIVPLLGARVIPPVRGEERAVITIGGADAPKVNPEPGVIVN